MSWQLVWLELQRLLVEQFGRPEALVTADASLTGTLMFDPLDLVDLRTLLGRELGVTAPLDALLAMPTLGDLARELWVSQMAAS